LLKEGETPGVVADAYVNNLQSSAQLLEKGMPALLIARQNAAAAAVAPDAAVPAVDEDELVGLQRAQTLVIMDGPSVHYNLILDILTANAADRLQRLGQRVNREVAQQRSLINAMQQQFPGLEPHVALEVLLDGAIGTVKSRHANSDGSGLHRYARAVVDFQASRISYNELKKTVAKALQHTAPEHRWIFKAIASEYLACAFVGADFVPYFNGDADLLFSGLRAWRCLMFVITGDIDVNCAYRLAPGIASLVLQLTPNGHVVDVEMELADVVGGLMPALSAVLQRDPTLASRTPTSTSSSADVAVFCLIHLMRAAPGSNDFTGSFRVQNKKVCILGCGWCCWRWLLCGSD
jgi:hypothetical protein